MVRKVTFLSIWFFSTFLYLLSCLIIFQQLLTNGWYRSKIITTSPLSDAGLIDREHNSGKILDTDIYAADGRLILLNQFLNKSPLEQYAQIFIDEADKYNLDYRLVPSIAMCESNLGKRIPSSTSFNAWGIGVYTGQIHGATFSGWPQAIRWVYEYIYNRYIEKGRIDLYDIASIWAPSSVEKGHSWANCVQSFMDKIE